MVHYADGRPIAEKHASAFPSDQGAHGWKGPQVLLLLGVKNDIKIPCPTSFRRRYGVKSKTAVLLRMSTGRETCSCVIVHLSSDRRNALLTRTQ